MDSGFGYPATSTHEYLSDERDAARAPFHDHAERFPHQNTAQTYRTAAQLSNYHSFSSIDELESDLDSHLSPLLFPLNHPQPRHGLHRHYTSPSEGPSFCSAEATSSFINAYSDGNRDIDLFATDCNERPLIPRLPQSSSQAESSLCAAGSQSLLLSSDSDYSLFMSTTLKPSAISSGPNSSALCAREYSPRFPSGHTLHPSFVRLYHLCDELGSGGYGFVMTAINRQEGFEVAVKFVIKNKVPEQAWAEDEIYGRLPVEVMLLTLMDHENIVKCFDVFEDDLYFYLVQELHGSPWQKSERPRGQDGDSSPSMMPMLSSPPPLLSPSASEVSATDSEPDTPPQYSNQLYPSPLQVHVQIAEGQLHNHVPHTLSESEDKCSITLSLPPRPHYSRRASHDLFECIEQTQHKRLSENQARYILAQVVDAVYYLDCRGISHRDIKDENLVVDKDLKVKLIDFGSATIADVSEPRPYHKLFYGTTAYASSEVLQKKPYQAPPAEIWTLGVLMSYLLTGMSPFPTERDAIEGRIVLSEEPGSQLSHDCLHLMSRCLEPDPEKRADIKEVRGHRWLRC